MYWKGNINFWDLNLSRNILLKFARKNDEAVFE